MSEDLFNVTLEAVEKTSDGLQVKINGATYLVLGYVEPFVSRRKIGDKVDISYGVARDEKTAVLTKISPHREGGAGPKKSEKKPEEKPASKGKVVEAVLRKIADSYFMVTEAGKDKIVLYCLTPEMKDIIQSDPDFRPPQKVNFSIDAHSWILGCSLGEQVSEDSLPPIAAPMRTAAQIKEDKEKAKALEQVKIQQEEKKPEEKQEAPKPEEKKPDEEKKKEPSMEENKDNCTSSPACSGEALSFQEGYTMRLGGTCSLDGYENIKLEIEGLVDPRKPEDREALIRYWDETLGLFGRNSPVTKDKIETFRRRVIMGALSSMEPQTQERSQKADRSEPDMAGVAYGTGTA